MRKPESVRQCETIIYGSLAASALVALIDKWLGAIGTSEFGFQLIIYGLFCMIPYKLGKGSNPARYVYVITSLIGLLLMMGGGIKVRRLDLVLSVVMIPVTLYVCWTLFQPAASHWFTGGDDDGGPADWSTLKERREPK